MTKLQKDRLKKSSRSKADLFEVLVAEQIAKIFGIKKNFKPDINKLIKILKRFQNGSFRIEEQLERTKRTSKELTSFLKINGINNIKNIEWIGRYH